MHKDGYTVQETLDFICKKVKLYDATKKNLEYENDFGETYNFICGKLSFYEGIQESLERAKKNPELAKAHGFREEECVKEGLTEVFNDCYANKKNTCYTEGLTEVFNSCYGEHKPGSFVEIKYDILKETDDVIDKNESVIDKKEPVIEKKKIIHRVIIKDKKQTGGSINKNISKKQILNTKLGKLKAKDIIEIGKHFDIKPEKGKKYLTKSYVVDSLNRKNKSYDVIIKHIDEKFKMT